MRVCAVAPGVLGELAALAEVLDRTPDWRTDAAAVRARMLVILGDVAERMLQQGAVLQPLPADNSQSGRFAACTSLC